MNISQTKIFLFLIPLVLILVLGAQTAGTLTGTVNNTTGAPVPNAAVTVTPLAGGASQRVLTGPDGTFTISGLPPGSYRVEVEYSGYKRSSVQNLDLAAAAGPASIRVELQSGNTQETVEVQATAILVQHESGERAEGFTARNVTETPIYDRNHQELVQFSTGVTPPHALESRVLDPQRDRIWETNGLANGTNYRTLDGVPNTEPFTGSSVYVTPAQGVQQLNLITSNYDAQYGRAGGSILNPVTRRGSNEVHGSLFEFNSNNAMAARNFFNPKGFPQAHSTVNQFGASVGGPVRRDSTFFFINYEGMLDRTQIPTVATVPTADFRAGNFSAVPGLTLYSPATGTTSGAGRVPYPNNIIPASRISPQALALQSNFPLPNADGFENNLLTNVPYRNDGHRGDVRFDHKMRDTTNLFLRWSYADYVTYENSPLGLLGGGNGHLQNHNAMIGGSHSFSPSGIVDLRLSYTRYSDRLASQASGLTPGGLGFSDPNLDTFASAGFTNPGIPQISINGMQSAGSPASLPQANIDNNYNITNGWNLVTGRNNLHFGFDVWHIRGSGFQNYAYGPAAGYVFGPGATASPQGNGLGPYGTFANSYASFLLGAPAQAGRDLPYWNPSYTQWQGAAYLADTFKVTSRLTLDLGARWDVFSPLAPTKSQGVFIYDPTSNQLLPTNTNGVTNVGNRDTKWTNIAPRFGFAYHPANSTVVRGGYGINFFNGPQSFWAGSLITNPGTASGGLPGGFSVAPGATLGQLPSVSSTASFSTATSALPAPNVPLIYTPSGARTPYVQNFDFLIQQDLGRYGLVATVGYAGNLGRELPYSREINAAAPGTGEAGQPLNAQFGRTASTIERSTGLTSNYNSLQASLTKRFGQDLSFTAAYTYSRSLDHGTGGVTPLLNNLNFQSNYGPSDWDRTHMFTLSHIWQIPIGANTHFLNEGILGKILGPWQFGGVLRWVSGTPFTVTADPTLCNCPGNTPTASTVVTGVTTTFVPVPAFYGLLPVPYQSLNFAFTQPPAGTLGNLGRNSVRGSGFTNYDLSLFRSFVVHEQTKLEIRGEAYNIGNTPHFANPIANVNSANFGQSISTLPYAAERRLQVAVRILF
jgi:hypothetical protein